MAGVKVSASRTYSRGIRKARNEPSSPLTNVLYVDKLLPMKSVLGFLGVAGLLALAAFGCSSSKETLPDKPGVDAGDTGVILSKFTYWRDTKPIFEAHCVGCHHDGGIAPFGLTNYAEAQKRVGLIPEKVRTRTMPPWPPNDECNHYENDRSLTDEQIATLADWAEGAAPEGNPADYKAPASQLATLPRVDFNVSMSEAYQPVLGPDEYRCFVLDWPETTTKYVTGFNVNPGQPQMVHHAIAYYATPADVKTYQDLDAKDAAPGYPCFGGPGGPGGGAKVGWLGAWVPGSTPYVTGTAMGIKVEPGSKVVLQLHYNTLKTKAVPDKTTIDFVVEDKVDKEAFLLKWVDPKWLGFGGKSTMIIPPGNADVMHRYEDVPDTLVAFEGSGIVDTSKPFLIHGAGLHMHTRGIGGKLEVIRSSSTEPKQCALQIDNWSFHWQGNYRLTKPTTVNPGDKLAVECHWDNTADNQPTDGDGKPLPVKQLAWGETTEDEMCLGVFYVTQ